MSLKTRLYRVKSTSGAVRLVEATTPAGARSFVARNDYAIDIPAQHEIYAMARDGVLIEVASEAPISDETKNAVAQTEL